MKRHEIKCWPEPFQAMAEGFKTAEFRLNDRDYKVGDLLDIQEWDPRELDHPYSGNEVKALITHALDLGLFGAVGYVLLSLTVRSVTNG